MPQFQVDIQKVVGTEYFTNVYHLEAASLTDAQTMGFAIVDAEKLIHHENVLFDRMRVSAMPVSGGVFIATGLTGPGLAPGPADVPLFVVARMEFTTGFGRPGIKMYRGVLTEGDLVGLDALSTAFITFMSGWVGDLIDAVPTLQKVNGEIFVGGSVSPTPGMRQLRRGSAKRTEPVI